MPDNLYDTSDGTSGYIVYDQSTGVSFESYFSRPSPEEERRANNELKESMDKKLESLDRLVKNDYVFSNLRDIANVSYLVDRSICIYLHWYKALQARHINELAVLTVYILNEYSVHPGLVDIPMLLNTLYTRNKIGTTQDTSMSPDEYIKQYNPIIIPNFIFDINDIIRAEGSPLLSEFVTSFKKVFSKLIHKIEPTLKTQQLPDVIDITSLYSISVPFMYKLICRGIYLLGYNRYLYTVSMHLDSYSLIKNYYYKAMSKGINIDDNVFKVLADSAILIDAVGAGIKMLYSPILNKVYMTYYQQDLSLEATEADIKSRHPHFDIFDRISDNHKNDIISIGQHSVSKKLFEEATECDIEELLTNLEFEESQ